MEMIEKDLEVAYNLIRRNRLKWCKSNVCACMGCANHEISKEQWDRIMKLPEINEYFTRQQLAAQEKFKANIIKLKEKFS